MSQTLQLEILADNIVDIAGKAGDIIMRYFKTDLDIEKKTDTTHEQDYTSPVTIADQQAERYIIGRLEELTPDIPIIGEESVSEGCIPEIPGSYFWLVDPLDGTKEFLTQSGEFTVNIALIEDGKPVLGVVYAPALGETYVGYGETAFLIKSDQRHLIKVRPFPDIGITVVASKRHGSIEEMENFLAGMKVSNYTTRGSSLKFCLLANGVADIYPRFGPTYEWDTAAGDAVLRAAGGMTYSRDGKIFQYRKKDFWNREFVASSKPFKL